MPISSKEKDLWFKSLPGNASWTALWSGYVLCDCKAIRTLDACCFVCQQSPPSLESEEIILKSGKKVIIPVALPGGEGRYEDYIFIQMMQREWTRSTSDNELEAFPMLREMSTKASVVLLYWTYFETRIERLLKIGLDGVPESLSKDTLNKYSSIGVRLDKFYKVVFDSTYYNDLKILGYEHLIPHITNVQKKRNEFIHGNPRAIDDKLVYSVVKNLQDDHEAWIKIYNKCISIIRSRII